MLRHVLLCDIIICESHVDSMNIILIFIYLGKNIFSIEAFNKSFKIFKMKIRCETHKINNVTTGEYKIV